MPDLSADLRDAFDAASNRWILRRHATVSAALADAALTVGAEPDEAAARAVHREVRSAVRAALPPQRLAEWRLPLARSAAAFVGALPRDVPCDLLAAYAAPWSLALACTAAGVTDAQAPVVSRCARAIFHATAMSRGDDVSPHASGAAAELAAALGAARGPLDVQSFVALAETLPHFLAGAWHALFLDPPQFAALRGAAGSASAIDELLRVAGPSRAVFRRAARDTTVGGCQVREGQRVTLMLHAANHDPSVFPDPRRLDIARDASAQLAFGRGAHSCVGASIIRLAAQIATDALVADGPRFVAVDGVEWLDGFAIRAPSSLVVTVSDRPPS